jgi:hypothetical protein
VGPARKKMKQKIPLSDSIVGPKKALLAEVTASDDDGIGETLYPKENNDPTTNVLVFLLKFMILFHFFFFSGRIKVSIVFNPRKLCFLSVLMIS